MDLGKDNYHDLNKRCWLEKICEDGECPFLDSFWNTHTHTYEYTYTYPCSRFVSPFNKEIIMAIRRGPGDNWHVVGNYSNAGL